MTNKLFHFINYLAVNIILNIIRTGIKIESMQFNVLHSYVNIKHVTKNIIKLEGISVRDLNQIIQEITA